MNRFCLVMELDTGIARDMFFIYGQARGKMNSTSRTCLHDVEQRLTHSHRYRYCMKFPAGGQKSRVPQMCALRERWELHWAPVPTRLLISCPRHRQSVNFVPAKYAEDLLARLPAIDTSQNQGVLPTWRRGDNGLPSTGDACKATPDDAARWPSFTHAHDVCHTLPPLFVRLFSVFFIGSGNRRGLVNGCSSPQATGHGCPLQSFRCLNALNNITV